MAAKDLFHPHVVKALERDGWTITDDPLSLPWGTSTLQVDLGAERLLAAVKGAEYIAVEIKSFVSRSRIDDLENALGQLLLYRYLLRQSEPQRVLYLAITEEVYQTFLSLPHVAQFLQSEQIRLLVFDPQTEEVTRWIN